MLCKGQVPYNQLYIQKRKDRSNPCLSRDYIPLNKTKCKSLESCGDLQETPGERPQPGAVTGFTTGTS